MKKKGGNLSCLLLALGVISTANANQAALKAVSDANNHFSSDLYDVIRKSSSDNIIVSPISVSTILAMLQAGAQGETKDAIRTSLYFPDDNQLHAGYNVLLQELRSDKNVVIRSANKIYPAADYELNDQFVETLDTYYGGASATPTGLNFSANADDAAATINSYVSSVTGGKISNIVAPNDFSSSTRLALVNAIYFQGDWKTQFPKERTYKADFHVSKNSRPVKVDMMRLSTDVMYGYIPELDAVAVSLPYKGDTMSMIILLPNERFNLAKLEEKLGVYPLDKIQDKLTHEMIDLYVPKFKLESTIDLENPLTQLDLGDIFSSKKANFTGISEDIHNLFVNKVVQKAFIEVNEEGSEAAAATASIVDAWPSPSLPKFPPREFVVDQPFLSVIMTNRISNNNNGGKKTPKANNILFYARVNRL